MSAIRCSARGDRIGFRDSADRRAKFVGCSAAENDESVVVVSGQSDTSHLAREHRIADCHVVDNADHGIEVTDAADRADLAIDDYTIAGNGGRGISIDAGAPVGRLSIHDNGDYGILHRGGDRDLSITGCGVHDNAADGIGLDAGDGAYRGLSTVANRCHGHSGRGIALRDNVGYPTDVGGRTTVADGGVIDHGLAEEPSVVTVEPRPPARAFPREIDDERVVVGLVDAGEAPIDEAEPVLWEARAY